MNASWFLEHLAMTRHIAPSTGYQEAVTMDEHGRVSGDTLPRRAFGTTYRGGRYRTTVPPVTPRDV